MQNFSEVNWKVNHVKIFRLKERKDLKSYARYGRKV